MTDNQPSNNTKTKSGIGAIIVIVLVLAVAGIVWGQSSKQRVASGTICPPPKEANAAVVPEPEPTQAPVAKSETPTPTEITPPESTPVADAKSNSTLPRFLDLGTTSCKPCKMMIPVIEELRTTYSGKLQVDFIDLTKNADAAKQYKVTGIPVQIFFDSSGKELYRHLGYWPTADIVNKWKELGFELK
jgi:thioredoxin 1